MNQNLIILEPAIVSLLQSWEENIVNNEREHFKLAWECQKYHKKLGLSAPILTVITTGTILYGFDQTKIADIMRVKSKRVRLE